ncbi:hypothetical protein K0M31_006798 [Melipona bicolor]|uniref:Uncharacterized protein n=1 Tax=Melipona bicolor TaxID=60889 RepID=A0AA40KLE5_9HYME|nr:hypothetical protein K0M31_006798 [Melipona bicolor]
MKENGEITSKSGSIRKSIGVEDKTEPTTRRGRQAKVESIQGKEDKKYGLEKFMTGKRGDKGEKLKENGTVEGRANKEQERERVQDGEILSEEEERNSRESESSTLIVLLTEMKSEMKIMREEAQKNKIDLLEELKRREDK